MSRISITRYHDICMGHRVYGHENKCKNLHGHNYRFYFTLESVDYDHHFTEDGTSTEKDRGLDSLGRVIDFSVIKDKLCAWLEENWDHKMIFWRTDPLGSFLFSEGIQGLVLVDFNPTAENIAIFMVKVLGPHVLEGSGVYLQKCVVEETRKCSAIAEEDCPPAIITTDSLPPKQINIQKDDLYDLPF